MSVAFPTGWRGRLLAVGILLVFALILWVGIASPLIGLYRDRAETLAEHRVLAAKMTEVAATLPRVKADAAQQSGMVNTPNLLLAGGSDALAEAGLQDTLNKTAAATGITLLSAETAPAKNVGAVRRVGVTISLQGKFDALVGFLARVDQVPTPLLIDDLQIRGLAHQDGARTLVRLTVYGFRAGGNGT